MASNDKMPDSGESSQTLSKDSLSDYAAPVTVQQDIRIYRGENRRDKSEKTKNSFSAPSALSLR